MSISPLTLKQIMPLRADERVNPSGREIPLSAAPIRHTLMRPADRMPERGVAGTIPTGVRHIEPRDQGPARRPSVSPARLTFRYPSVGRDAPARLRGDTPTTRPDTTTRPGRARPARPPTRAPRRAKD